MTPENFSTPDTSMLQFVLSIILFVGTFVASYKFKVHPILLIVICGAIGGVVYSL